MGKLPSNIENNTIKAQVHPKPQNKNTNSKRKMDNNTVYLGSTGRVTKMTGDNIVWEKQLGALYATPHVVVGKFGLYAAARRKLYELDPDTGAILSSVKIRSVSKVSNMGAHLQVDAAAEALYFVCNKGVAKVRTDVALDDPTAIAWERRVKKFSGPASTSGSVYALATDNGYLLARNKFACKLHTTFTLALDGSGSLVAADRGNLYPAPVQAREDSPDSLPKVKLGTTKMLAGTVGMVYDNNSDTLFCASHGQVSAHVSSAPYTVKWVNKLPGLRYGTGVSVAVASKAGLVFVGISGRVAALDITTGELQWKTEISALKSTPFVPLHVDAPSQKLYVGSMGSIAILDFADGSKSDIELSAGAFWGYVTFASPNGTSTSYSANPMTAAFEKHRRRAIAAAIIAASH